MDIKTAFELYGIKKLGVINQTQKKCLCGAETDSDVCPACGEKLPKSKLLNMAKTKAHANRYETKTTGNPLVFRKLQLNSNGLELVENEALKVEIDTEKALIHISNSKAFNALKSNEEFAKFINTAIPGFLQFTDEALQSSQGIMNSSMFSLSEAEISNMLYFYLNYKALIPYCLKYKIIYFGKNFNLKEFYPEADFNDPESLKSIDFNPHLLAFYDMKNRQYLQNIVELSKRADIQDKITEMMIELEKEAKKCLQSYCFRGECVLDTFNLLFNKEISIDDFIRIFNKSEPEPFFHLKEYKGYLKKFEKVNVDWSTFEGITSKMQKTMERKVSLTTMYAPFSVTEVNDIYAEVEKDPFSGYKKFHDLCIEKRAK